ncbi:MAG: lipopolysaccharide kinase InaA family protein [Myxococcota bacterium]
MRLPESAPLRLGGQRGRRLRNVGESTVARALDAHRRAGETGPAVLLKDDARSRVSAVEVAGRRVVVKEYPARGILRGIGDLLRGSAARRVWRGGHGLLARGIGAAQPLAFVERSRLGIPAGSAVVCEDVRPLRPADQCDDDVASPAAIAEALLQLLLQLHRGRVIHGDLKASHVFLGRRGAGLEARLVDLEGVRFPHRLGDAQRVRALAQLNASLPDRVPDAARRRAFDRYASLLPFRCGSEVALERVVELSLRRAHRWSGTRCRLAGRLRGQTEPRAQAETTIQQK